MLSNTSVEGKSTSTSIQSCLVIRYFMFSICLFIFGLKMSFETMRKNLVLENVHLEVFTGKIDISDLLIFVTLMSSPVWWQSMSRWWWFMTSDGCTSPPRWLCSGSWWAIGPWPPCTSAITMDGFSFLLVFSHRKNFEVVGFLIFYPLNVWFLEAEGTFIC